MVLSPDKNVTKHQESLNIVKCLKHLNGFEGSNS